MKRSDILKTLAVLFLLSIPALILNNCGGGGDDYAPYTPEPWQSCSGEVSTAYNDCVDTACSDCVGWGCLFCMTSCDPEFNFAARECCYRMFSGEEADECYYHFSPESRPCSISGSVTATDGAGVPDVELSSSASYDPTFTDTNGYYRFDELPCSSFEITPSKMSYCFSPESRSYSLNPYTIDPRDITEQDYTAILTCFSISGTITSAGGIPAPGITLQLSGTLSGSAVTDASSNYIFSNLQHGTYTITPQIPVSPESRTVTLSNADISGQDFLAIGNAISGMINASDGTPIPGGIVTLTGDASMSVISDRDGIYLLHVLPGTYTITPSSACPEYSFEPPSRTLTVVDADLLAQDFVGPVSSAGISGRITTFGSVPFPDVTVSLQDAASTSVTTDLNGDYTFSGIQAGGTYTITPSYTDFSFSPKERTGPLCEGVLSGQDFLGWSTWAKSYGIGGEFNDIQQTSDGSYIVAGYTSSFGAGSDDFLVLKLDSHGNILWQKAYGGLVRERANSIQETSDGGYIVAGQTGSFGAGGGDVWILKLDTSGDILWQKAYGGTSGDYAYSIQETSDGGYIVAGYTRSFGAGYDDFWILKLDATGNVLWQKAYGGTYWDQARSIQETTDGGYIVAGYTYSFGAGGTDLWILKLDATGNVLWQKTYGGTYWDKAHSIQETSDGSYIVAGYTPEGNNYGLWILKLDATGNVLWQKTYGYGGTSVNQYSIQETSDNGYIVAGPNLVMKLTASGNILWQKDLNYNFGDRTVYSIQEISDGGYLMAARNIAIEMNPNGDLNSCDLVTVIDTTVTDTNTSPLNSSATVGSTSATVTDTPVVPQDSSTTVTRICPAQ